MGLGEILISFQRLFFEATSSVKLGICYRLLGTFKEEVTGTAFLK